MTGDTWTWNLRENLAAGSVGVFRSMTEFGFLLWGRWLKFHSLTMRSRRRLVVFFLKKLL